MPVVHGTPLDASALRRRCPNLDAAAGARLVTLSDGPERGVRCIEIHNWRGLRFTVLIDRGMDIGDLEWRGTPLGWQSPTGYRAPWLTDSESEAGLGILRSFSGFMVTCGFDHARRAESGADPYFKGALRSEIDYPLHGRGALQPARLIGYGTEWIDDDLLLWCEGEIQQTSVFAEHLLLRRRIEVYGGGSRIRIRDSVRNAGFGRTPHMQLYHINLGWPLLDQDARFLAPIKDTVWANVPRDAQAFGCFQQSGPHSDPMQQLFVHRVNDDADGSVKTALINDRLGLGVSVAWRKSQLPWLQQWQCLTEGVFGFGIEPVTNRFGRRKELSDAGEIVMLDGGEVRNYEIDVEILDGEGQLSAASREIDALSAPREDYPVRTGATTP